MLLVLTSKEGRGCGRGNVERYHSSKCPDLQRDLYIYKFKELTNSSKISTKITTSSQTAKSQK